MKELLLFNIVAALVPFIRQDGAISVIGKGKYQGWSTYALSSAETWRTTAGAGGTEVG